MSRNRGEGGRFIEKASLTDVLDVLTARDEPVTGKEVGDALDISNRSALDKLTELHDRTAVERKKVGAGAVVWWLDDTLEIETEQTLLADTLSAAEAVAMLRIPPESTSAQTGDVDMDAMIRDSKMAWSSVEDSSR